MDLTGEYTIAASRQDVWDALNDPEVLKLCIPGCEEMEKLSDTQFTAKVTMKVGAVKARLKGNVELSDIDAPNSYAISGQGQGGVAGFAKGGARVSLSDGEGGATILHYEANAELGGKLAAVGSRVIQGISKKMADEFFGKFSRHLSGEIEETTPTKAAPSADMQKPGESQEAGMPDWLKSALVHAVISIIAVSVAVMLVR
jgi:carbon monoxide dehydrogenase subunit G